MLQTPNFLPFRALAPVAGFPALATVTRLGPFAVAYVAGGILRASAFGLVGKPRTPAAMPRGGS